jgi:hypothetical protein
MFVSTFKICAVGSVESMCWLIPALVVCFVWIFEYFGPMVSRTGMSSGLKVFWLFLLFEMFETHSDLIDFYFEVRYCWRGWTIGWMQITKAVKQIFSYFFRMRFTDALHCE